MNEGSGDQIWDHSNHGNIDHQSILYGPRWIPGPSGPALLFTTDDYMEETDVRFRVGGEGTISARAYTTTTDRATLVMKDKAGYVDDVKLQIDADAKAPGKMVFDFNRDSDNTIQWIADPVTIPLNTWLHYVGTWGPNGMRLYRDGVLIASNSAVVTLLSAVDSPLRIGLETTGAVNPWEGGIDDVRIWRRTLSDSEVAQLYYEPYAMWEPSYPQFGFVSAAAQYGNKVMGVAPTNIGKVMEVASSDINTVMGA